MLDGDLKVGLAFDLCLCVFNVSWPVASLIKLCGTFKAGWRVMCVVGDKSGVVVVSIGLLVARVA
jgi:hypothetical protein